jgi:hypothetical protein
MKKKLLLLLPVLAILMVLSLQCTVTPSAPEEIAEELQEIVNEKLSYALENDSVITNSSEETNDLINLNTIRTDKNIQSIKISSNRLFVYYRSDSDNFGFQIWNISDLQNPVLMKDVVTPFSSFNIVSHVLTDKYLIIGMFDGFCFYNIQDPGKVRLTYHATNENWSWCPTGIAVHNGYLYIANKGVFDSWIHVYDLKNPSYPVKVNDIVMGTDAFSMVIRNNILYIGGLESHLTLFDLKNPENPVGLPNHLSDGYGYNLFITDRYGFLVNYTNTIYMLDISNSHDVRLVDGFRLDADDFQTIHSMFYSQYYTGLIAESKIYLINTEKKLLLKTFNLPFKVIDVEVTDQTIMIADENGEIGIITF